MDEAQACPGATCDPEVQNTGEDAITDSLSAVNLNHPGPNTTAMDDEQIRQSRNVFETMDRLGYSEEDRKTVIKESTTKDILITFINQLTRKKSTYTFGSFSEGTLCPKSSDVDMLTCTEDIPVVDRLDDGPACGPCLLTVSEPNTHPGYTKLQSVSDRHPLTIKWRDHGLKSDGRGRLMQTNDVMKHIHKISFEINGPASTVTMLGDSRDIVSAYRYKKWPAIAVEWKTRGRRYNWPSTEVINKLCSLGCFLVPKGYFLSPEVDIEWMFSFALQERELMRSLNAVQFKCYVLLKYIKDKITDELGKSITSYHCKTCIFYAIESKTEEFWTPDNFNNCLLFCVSILLRSLERRVCPNYFIPEDNMFKKMFHGELLAKSADLLKKIVEHKFEFIFDLIFDLKTTDIGYEDNVLEEIRREMLAKRAARLLEMRRVYVGIGTSHALQRLLKYALVNNDLVSCIKAHLELIRKLKNTKIVTEHTKEQTTDAIDSILPCLYTSLASHEAAQLAKSRGSHWCMLI